MNEQSSDAPVAVSAPEAQAPAAPSSVTASEPAVSAESAATHTSAPATSHSAFNLSALAVREGAVTLFFIIAVAVAGTFAFFQLGRAEDPVFTVKAMTVTAVWPGATAQEMQDLVAEPMEKRLQELRWYDRVETFTRQGLVYMTLNLRDSTPPSAVQEQFYQARKKLGDETANLPKGALGPFINDEYSDVSFALYAVKAHGMPPRELVRHAEALRQRLLHVPGVKKVDILGERPEKIFVEFTYAKLATLGVSPRDIFTALNQQNAVTPAGSVETRGPQVFVRLDGAFTDLQKLRDMPIAATGTPVSSDPARVLKLSDVAEVRRGYEDPPTYLISHNGEPSLVLSVVMREGWNGLDLGKSLRAEEQKVANELPLGIIFAKISDQAENITESIDEFMLKFFVALTVVLVVSLISLGWRVGVVVAAAVPLTLAAVFVVMLATDRVFDRITLGALILSLGLLVDDAIIAIEMMVVKMEEGMARVDAAAFAWTVTAAPMLAGTLLTVIGLMPVGFAKSGAGEYAGNIFWIVCFSLIASWLVAVIFTPYMGVKLLPDIRPVAGGHTALYATPNYQRLRALVEWCVRHKFAVAGATAAIFFASVLGMGAVKQQFFPSSDRSEVLVEVRLPSGTSIETTKAATEKIEKWLREQPDALIVTSYVGRGAPRFFLSLNPELPDPSFAKIIILTPDAQAREQLKLRLRERIAQGLVPEARVRVTQLVFGPFVPFPVMFRVMGPDSDLTKLREIADKVETIMRANPHMRDVNHDSGDRVPTAHFVLDQDRLKLIGLSPQNAAEQLQFLLNGVAVTQVREDIRTVDVMARAAGWNRMDPSRLSDLTLGGKDGRPIPLDQIGRVEIRTEEPILTRRDRTPTITVRGDIDERMQPPEVTVQVQEALKPLIGSLPAGYRIETSGIVEESGKANVALAAVFPIMILLMLVVIMLQVRSFAGMMMVFLTAPLGLAGTVPILLLFNVPFGFNAIVGLIGLAGILMRNTLILVGQIDDNQNHHGMDSYHAVVEATVQRARPVILTAMAAVLAFIPLTQSSFWGPLAYTLIGGTAAGTVLTLLFLPALFAIWFGVKPKA
ncbi:MAG TPA: efflux RND transporter permease subunit [Candidatus Methylacidiphilales bacterium]|nr:efflux RND transporter permease subunit [Candidatus Methylacidiphilales bacterium]